MVIYLRKQNKNGWLLLQTRKDMAKEDNQVVLLSGQIELEKIVGFGWS